MRKTAPLLLALTCLAAIPPIVAGAASTPATGSPDRLAVSFFTAGFLADVTERIESERTEKERLDGGYLQEETGLIWAETP